MDVEKNMVNIMGPYDPAEPLALLIEQLENWQEFTQEGGRKISNTMVV